MVVMKTLLPLLTTSYAAASCSHSTDPSFHLHPWHCTHCLLRTAYLSAYVQKITSFQISSIGISREASQEKGVFLPLR